MQQHSRSAALPAENVVRPDGQGRQSPSEALPVVTPYVPLGQGLHDVEPGPAAYVPISQVLQLTAPAELKVPAAHGAQSLRRAAPLMALAVPAGQAMHEVLPCPGMGLKKPAAHGVQLLGDVAAMSSRKRPAAQGRAAAAAAALCVCTQATSDACSAPRHAGSVPRRARHAGRRARSGRHRTRGQSWHDADRGAAEKVPAAQAEQAAAPGALKLPGAHGMHESRLVALGYGLAVPAGQARQDDEP